MAEKSVSRQTLKRLPLYLKYIKSMSKAGAENISATAIAEALDLNDVQVRKDLASVSAGGRPRIGYVIQDLILTIEKILGYRDTESAVLIGAGELGQILLSYKGFAAHGLNIVAGFDTDESLIGQNFNGKPILPIEKLDDLCKRLKVRVGIITVPASAAQETCDKLIQSGALAIWNFAPVQLKVPEKVLVHNEDWFSSLDLLLKHLHERLNYLDESKDY
jgi:redox-sensing transcriptional repressor